jgi:endonuclease III
VAAADPEAARRARTILGRLRREYPHMHCELTWSTPMELAVAAILSAQCTDRRVNLVTPALFKKYHTAAEWAATPQATLEAEIRSTGFFRNKAKNIRALAQMLVERHGGELPSDFDALVSLPGIGRKTANLLVATIWGQPGIIVDTHCTRLSQRLGFTRHTDPVRIEFDLRALVPPKDWTDWSHAMVFHGRYCCHARAPECARCPIAGLCPYFAARPPAPSAAAAQTGSP